MDLVACSGKNMEVGKGLKTLDCLRGRLLAERQASRSAKEEAQLMGEKLIELENQIRKETELRNKAEKRLKLLIKKLESLNIASSTSLAASEISTLSESSTNSSALKETEKQESRSENVESTISKNQCEKVPEIATSKQRDEKEPNQYTPDRANSSPNSESRNNSCTDPHRSCKIPQRKDQRISKGERERALH